MPSARPITVAMTQLAGPATARWNDPTDGTFAPIAGSPIANAASHVFRPPSTHHADGASYRVLALESAH